MPITTYEASKKYRLSMTHLRLLLGKGILRGRQAPLTDTRKIWLLDEASLKSYLKKDRKPGRKPKKRS